MNNKKEIICINDCYFPRNALTKHQKISVFSKTLPILMKTLINTLDVFHKYAEKNNIIYSLHGGSLMGYYWNKNIIPWDDDVDVIVRGKDIVKINKLWESGKPINVKKYSSGFNNKLTRIIKLNNQEYEIIKNVPSGIKTLFKLRPRNHNCFINRTGGIDIIYCMEYPDGSLRDSWNPHRICGGPSNKYTEKMCPIVDFSGIKTRALINKIGEKYLDIVYSRKWRIKCHPSLKY